MMFRDKSISKFYAFSLAAVFALTLAGCGGNGGGTADTTDPGTTTPVATPEEMCTTDGGRWNADETCTTATELATEKAEADAAAAKAATAAALTKDKQIAAEAAGQIDAAGLGGSDAEDQDGDPTYSMTIKRDNDGTTVEIADSANADKDEDPQFAQVADLGGGLTRHDRDNGKGEMEVVMVKTDIEAPTATAFGKVYTLNRANDDFTTPVEADADPGPVAIPVTADEVGMIAATRFASTGTAAANTVSFAADDDATKDKDEAAVEGTFDGAAGTYRCVDDNGCTVTVDAKGKVTGVGDNEWVFVPDTGVTVDVADKDYMSYGFWLMRTTDKDGTTYNEVQTFASSNVAASDGIQLDAVEGSANYEGGAVGVYVHKVNPTGASVPDSATAGHFTADASLMVYFGGDDVTVNKKNSVTGSITNFDLSGGEENGWSVALKGGRESTENTISGSANGGGVAGTFSGTFHGPTGITASTTDPGTNRDMPGSIVGEFDANFSNGTVAGGFGARKQ